MAQIFLEASDSEKSAKFLFNYLTLGKIYNFLMKLIILRINIILCLGLCWFPGILSYLCCIMKPIIFPNISHLSNDHF